MVGAEFSFSTEHKIESHMRYNIHMSTTSISQLPGDCLTEILGHIDCGSDYKATCLVSHGCYDAARRAHPEARIVFAKRALSKLPWWALAAENPNVDFSGLSTWNGRLSDRNLWSDVVGSTLADIGYDLGLLS